MPELPSRPSLEHLRKQAKARTREQGGRLSDHQHRLARDHGFASWPRLVHHVESTGLTGIEHALAVADPAELSTVLSTHRTLATTEIDGMPPILLLLRHSIGTPSDVRKCTTLLLDAGAEPGSTTDMDDWGRSALFDAVERNDLTLVRLLLDAGASPDEDAFYHACEQGGTAFLDALYAPGFEHVVNHKLDFEDAAGLRWFLERGVDVNAQHCLPWAIGRGRGTQILRLLLDAGADVNLPDAGGRAPLNVAARCGHLAAYDLLTERGARAELDEVERRVLAVARGESADLPDAPAPVLWVPEGDGYGWIVGQFAALGRTDVLTALLDAGWHVDTRGWSNFTPLDQAAMHGRTDTVRLLLARGADVTDTAFDAEYPTPLDCAIWGLTSNPAADGDYPGTVAALLAAHAPTRLGPPTGDPEVDALLPAVPS